jgi:hypothetical protein
MISSIQARDPECLETKQIEEYIIVKVQRRVDKCSIRKPRYIPKRGERTRTECNNEPNPNRSILTGSRWSTG